MNTEEKEMVVKIRKHLAKLHQEWDDDPEKDGHCKSNEGYVGIMAIYPNWFEARGTEAYLAAKPTYAIEVYSYLFGPNRLHQYRSIKEAWEDIKNW